MSIEAFTCLLVFKNIFSFGMTFKGFDWIVDAGRRSGVGGGGGIKNLFVAVGSVQVAICALTIPMCKSWTEGGTGIKADMFDRHFWQEEPEFFSPSQCFLCGNGLGCG
jgi:hypothetical protein